MPSSSPTLLPRRFESSTQSSMVTPETGTKGQTSVAPCRGCAPVCSRMSMSSAAFFMSPKADSSTASGSPAKVITVLLVAAPGSTSSIVVPSTSAAAFTTWSITARSLPSEMLGTHSTILADMLIPSYS